MKNVRDYNVGKSNYAKHKIQPWDIILEYHLNVTPYVGVWIETVTGATRIM